MGTAWFTRSAENALSTSRKYAISSRKKQIGPEHLLMALLKQEEGEVQSVIERATGRDLATLFTRLRKAVGRGPLFYLAPRGVMRLAESLRRCLAKADELANLGDKRFIDEGDLLLALAMDTGSDTACFLDSMGCTPERLRELLSSG